METTEADPVSGEIKVAIGRVIEIDDEHEAQLTIRCIYGISGVEPLLQFVVFTTVESIIKQLHWDAQSRFDEDEPITSTWYYAHYTEGDFRTGLFYNPQSKNSNDDARRFIERLKTANRFGVRFSSSQNAATTVLWEDLSGFDEVYRPVAEACGEAVVDETPTLALTPTPTPTPIGWQKRDLYRIFNELNAARQETTSQYTTTLSKYLAHTETIHGDYYGIIDPYGHLATASDRRRFPHLPLHRESAPYHYIASLHWVYEGFFFNVYCYINKYLVPAETIEALGKIDELAPITVRGSLDPLQSGEWQSLRLPASESGTILGLDVSLRDCEITQYPKEEIEQ